MLPRGTPPLNALDLTEGHLTALNMREELACISKTVALGYSVAKSSAIFRCKSCTSGAIEALVVMTCTSSSDPQEIVNACASSKNGDSEYSTRYLPNHCPYPDAETEVIWGCQRWSAGLGVMERFRILFALPCFPQGKHAGRNEE